MTSAFNKILVPVDFSVNTEIAVQKAIGLTGGEGAVIHREEGDAIHRAEGTDGGEGTVIHLLHVIKPVKSAVGKFNNWEAEKKMEQWRSVILERNPSINVKTHILKGSSVEDMIIECAGLLKPDLLIIGKQKGIRRWSFFRPVSPDAIARKSNCPVLTAKPGSILSRTRVILIPIRHFFPERKLELGILLAKKYKAQVHLLAIQGDGRPQKEDLSPIFLRAYHQLREKLHMPIEYSSVTRHNPVKATLDYAERIMADMIVVNPETESGMHGFTGARHISDWLERDSKIQVLDVQPYG